MSVPKLLTVTGDITLDTMHHLLLGNVVGRNSSLHDHTMLATCQMLVEIFLGKARNLARFANQVRHVGVYIRYMVVI